MRPFLGFDAGFSIAAEQRDRVSNSEIGVIACIQHNLIHGDRPHLRQWAAPMQSVDPAAESPDHPIGIADRDDGQSACPRCDVAVAVAHTRPCLALYPDYVEGPLLGSKDGNRSDEKVEFGNL